MRPFSVVGVSSMIHVISQRGTPPVPLAPRAVDCFVLARWTPPTPMGLAPPAVHETISSPNVILHTVYFVHPGPSESMSFADRGDLTRPEATSFTIAEVPHVPEPILASLRSTFDDGLPVPCRHGPSHDGSRPRASSAVAWRRMPRVPFPTGRLLALDEVAALRSFGKHLILDAIAACVQS